MNNQVNKLNKTIRYESIIQKILKDCVQELKRNIGKELLNMSNKNFNLKLYEYIIAKRRKNIKTKKNIDPFQKETKKK